MLRWAIKNLLGCFSLTWRSSSKGETETELTDTFISSVLADKLSWSDSKKDSVKGCNLSTQEGQQKLSPAFPILLYSATFIFKHFLWVQLSQKSQRTAWALPTFLLHSVQGYLTGPGFVATSLLLSIRHCRVKQHNQFLLFNGCFCYFCILSKDCFDWLPIWEIVCSCMNYYCICVTNKFINILSHANDCVVDTL